MDDHESVRGHRRAGGSGVAGAAEGRGGAGAGSLAWDRPALAL